MKKIITSFVLAAAIAVAILMIESRPSTTTVVEAAPVIRVVSEMRCGWFSNPTPANAWLNDATGEWIIGEQGGYQADGDWPDFKPAEWVKTNGEYGYGCACMTVTTNKSETHILKILKAWPKPLAACRSDKKLKEPKAG